MYTDTDVEFFGKFTVYSNSTRRKITVCALDYPHYPFFDAETLKGPSRYLPGYTVKSFLEIHESTA